MSNNRIVIKEVPGFNGYFVGSDGSFWSEWCRSGGKKGNRKRGDRKRIFGWLDRDGYTRVQCSLSGNKKVNIGLHTLVLLAFRGPCPNGMECRHLDGNRQNNDRLNLRWGTCRQNQHDRKSHKTDNSGERNGRSKLTEDDVRECRVLRDNGMSYAEISRRFGVIPGTIQRILSGKRWKHLYSEAVR